MVTDPVSDLIIRLKNAGAVGKDRIVVPHSNFLEAVSHKLKDAGYIESVEQKGKKVKKSLEIVLKYEKGGEPVIQGVKRVSKPSRRIYRGVDEVSPVRYGHGALVLTTPKGVMTDTEARKERVGGEPLFEIW